MCILNYEVFYNNTIYNRKQDIFVRPLNFIKLLTNIPSTITESTPSSIEYSISGLTSSNDLINISNDVQLIFPNCDFIEVKDNKIIIDKNKIDKNKSLNYLISYRKNTNNIFNTIIDVQKLIIDLPILEFDNFSIELNAKTDDPYILNSNDKFNNIEYQIKILANNIDITNEVEIINELKSNNIKLNNNIIISNDLDNNITLLSITYNKFGKNITKHKYILFKSFQIKDIEINGNTIIENYESQYEYLCTAIFENNETKQINEYVNIELASGNPDLIQSIDKNKIMFIKNKSGRSENLCFKVTYNNFIKFIIITLK